MILTKYILYTLWTKLIFQFHITCCIYIYKSESRGINNLLWWSIGIFNPGNSQFNKISSSAFSKQQLCYMTTKRRTWPVTCAFFGEHTRRHPGSHSSESFAPGLDGQIPQEVTLTLLSDYKPRLLQTVMWAKLLNAQKIYYKLKLNKKVKFYDQLRLRLTMLQLCLQCLKNYFCPNHHCSQVIWWRNLEDWEEQF